jgi:predicted DNA-binding protein|tara:strand:- start:288 stop:497 length:210 start_codon:yes stop_codon:yes gene_type:complete
MGRPHKILEPTKTYNLLLTTNQYDRLAAMSSKLQETSREQVAVADLIRDAIEAYLDALEETDDEKESQD